MATAGWSLFKVSIFCVKTLATGAGLTWNSFPLCLRISTFEPAEPVGTPSGPIVVEPRRTPAALTQLVTTSGASTVAPDSPVSPVPPLT